MSLHRHPTHNQPFHVSYPARQDEQLSIEDKSSYQESFNDWRQNEAQYPPQNYLQKPYLTPQPSYTSSTSELESSPPHRRTNSIPLSQFGAEMKSDGRRIWSSILPDSIACRLYVLTVLIETCIDLAIEADMLIRVNAVFESVEDSDRNDPNTNITLHRLPVYLSIFALAHLFQLVMAIDAVRARNTLQFIFLTIFNAFFLVYGVVQIYEIQDALPPGTKGVTHVPVKILTTIIPIVISIAEVAYIALGWRIYTEFGWKVYKQLGADRTIKRIFAHYQIFECLIKFNIFFWIGYSIQFIALVLKNNDWEYYVTCAALPLSLLLLLGGHLAAKHESRWMMSTFMIGCITGCCYFVYKLYRIIVQRNDPGFSKVFKMLVSFSILSIFLLVLTFTWACIVMRNFESGLKSHLTRKKTTASGGLRRNGTHKAQPSGRWDTDANRISRMTID